MGKEKGRCPVRGHRPRAQEQRTSSIPRISDIIQASKAWSHLRHERERRIALYYFWQGWGTGASFQVQRQKELAEAGPDAQALYRRVGGGAGG